MKKRINAKVFCRNNEYGKMDFYLEMDREFFYLYFAKNIYEQYYNGRRLEEMYSKTSMSRHQKLKERILRMSKYIAQENAIDLFEKSHKPTYKRRKNDYFDYEAA
ncbi:MAG: hypothetical protein NC247_10545 [Ruminococcus flavefaciens]|nr:hypothetical protein [Ruminococcus flavefaciens]MCM1361321.1 hypothetical protein [Clostridiales bacterium]